MLGVLLLTSVSIATSTYAGETLTKETLHQEWTITKQEYLMKYYEFEFGFDEKKEQYYVDITVPQEIKEGKYEKYAAKIKDTPSGHNALTDIAKLDKTPVEEEKIAKNLEIEATSEKDLTVDSRVYIEKDKNLVKIGFGTMEANLSNGTVKVDVIDNTDNVRRGSQGYTVYNITPSYDLSSAEIDAYFTEFTNTTVSFNYTLEYWDERVDINGTTVWEWINGTKDVPANDTLTVRISGYPTKSIDNILNISGAEFTEFVPWYVSGIAGTLMERWSYWVDTSSGTDIHTVSHWQTGEVNSFYVYYEGSVDNSNCTHVYGYDCAFDTLDGWRETDASNVISIAGGKLILTDVGQTKDYYLCADVALGTDNNNFVLDADFKNTSEWVRYSQAGVMISEQDGDMRDANTGGWDVSAGWGYHGVNPADMYIYAGNSSGVLDGAPNPDWDYSATHIKINYTNGVTQSRLYNSSGDVVVDADAGPKTTVAGTMDTLCIGGFHTGSGVGTTDFEIDNVIAKQNLTNPPTISYGAQESGSWTIEGQTFTKRRLVNVTTTVNLTAYQIELDYDHFNSTELAITDWEADSWEYRKQVNLTSGVNETLTDFPVHIVMDTASLISAGKMQGDCDDIRIMNSSVTGELSYEIETGTCNTSETVLWVKIPALYNSSTVNTVYVYYGNSTVLSGEDVLGVWDNGYYRMVLHLSDGNDSVSGTEICTGLTFNSTGGVYGGARTAGTCDLGYKPAAIAPSGFGVWFKGTDNGVGQAVFGSYTADYKGCYIHIRWNHANNDILVLDSGGNNVQVITGVAVTPDTWLSGRFIRRSTTDFMYYENYTAYPLAGNSGTTLPTNNVCLGARSYSGSCDNAPFTTGTIDEFRAYNSTSITNEYLLAEYSQGEVVGAEESMGGGGSSNPAPVMQSLAMTPATIYKNSTVYCAANWTDTNSSNFTVMIGLTVNGSIVAGFTQTNSSYQKEVVWTPTGFDISAYNIGDNLSCWSNATDGLNASGLNYTANKTIANSAPLAQNLTITALVFFDENATGTADIWDVDGSVVDCNFDWHVNGSSIYNDSQTNCSAAPSSSFGEGNYSATDVIMFIFSLNDSSVGTPVNSSDTVVQTYALQFISPTLANESSFSNGTVSQMRWNATLPWAVSNCTLEWNGTNYSATNISTYVCEMNYTQNTTGNVTVIGWATTITNVTVSTTTRYYYLESGIDKLAGYGVGVLSFTALTATYYWLRRRRRK